MIRTIVAASLAVATLAAPAAAATFLTLSGEAPKVIAHRGASGWLPEHTLGGYELAIRMGADIVEPDVQLTSDGFLVAMHDTTLTGTTNVQELFPGRPSYAVDQFTLAEIKTLTVKPRGGLASTSFPGFTPSMPDAFKVPTLEEVLDFVNAHNAATGDVIGVYPESKVPNRPELNQKVVQALNAKGFVSRDQNTYIQTFSHAGALEMSLLQDALGMDNAVAVLGSARLVNGVFGVLDATTGVLSTLEQIATYADGVGVTLSSPALNRDFVAAAHALGLEVHGWTFRPQTQEAADELFGRYIEIGMDAFFTDYPNFGRATVDAASVAPIPLPAAGWMLIAGVGGLLALRRRAA